MNPSQSLKTDDVGINVQINKLFQPHFKRIGAVICVRAETDQTIFNAFHIIWIARANIPRFSCFLENIVKLDTFRAVAKIDLKTTLLAPSTTLHNHGNAINFGFTKPKILQITHPVAYYARDNFNSFWAL